MHGKKKEEQKQQMIWEKMWKAFGADWRAEQEGCALGS